MDRLVCAKYIFIKSCEVLDKGGYFADGLAVLGFQDAAEMVLRVVAEFLHASFKKDDTQFNVIIDKIDEISSTKLSHNSALKQLNKARVNFKHYGLQPKKEDVIKFRKDLEVFFPKTFQLFLSLEYESVSLVHLIGHRRTENYLRQAEQHIANQKYKEAIDDAYRAFAIFQRCIERKRERENNFNFGISIEEFKIIEKKIKEKFEKQQNDIDILMYGINLADYKRFQFFATGISFARAGNFILHRHSNYREQYMNYENALFCNRFVIDAALLMKQNELPPSRLHCFRSEHYKNFRVLRKSVIIVYPSEKIEVIREAEVGEILEGNGEHNNGYISILQDDEDAYIIMDAVEEIPPDF